MGEFSAEWYGSTFGANAGYKPTDAANFAKLTTALVAAAGGANAMNVAGVTSSNAVLNNYLNHKDVVNLAEKIKTCGTDQACKDREIDNAYKISAANDAALLNCKATNNCAELRVEFREGYKDIQNLIGAGFTSKDVEQILKLENNAQMIILNNLDQKQCVTQACQDKAVFLLGVGTGLSKITPAGLVVGSGQAGYALMTSLLNNGATDTAIAIAKGVQGLPANLIEGLNSNDPKVRGEALVDALTVTSVVTAVGTKLGFAGVKAAANEPAPVGRTS